MSEIKAFLAWLQKNGAEILPPTNQYEIARFVARGQTNVVYQGRRGVSANGFALECWMAFREGRGVNMGFTQKPRGSMAKLKLVLIERDGHHCFYCAEPLCEDMTVEHLVSRHKGGPDHQDNLVLSHASCNKLAANLPLVEKIKLRESHARQPGREA